MTILLRVAAYFCLFALLSGAASLCAQTGQPGGSPRWWLIEDKVFQHLSVENGLPSNAVTTLAEDAQGFIWVGTQNGLARWDGYRFRTYSHQEQDKFSLPDNVIVSLFRDQRGVLWIGTKSGGLVFYDVQNDRFEPIALRPQAFRHATIIAGIWRQLRQALQSGSVSKKMLDQAIDEGDEYTGLALASASRAADLVTIFKTIAVQVDRHQLEEIDLANVPDHAFIDGREGVVTIRAQRDGDSIVIEIQDTGWGIAAEALPKVFDPFFTTRSGSFGHIGLGLHVAYNYVTQGLQGSLVVESVPGQGTCVRIRFKEAA
jgi:anti-sigma regulatory factor (Ser/Thr protein kinase)